MYRIPFDSRLCVRQVNELSITDLTENEKALGMMQNNDETGPLRAAFGSPYFLTLATGDGMLYTWKEYENWIKEAGFAVVLRQSLPDGHGVITGIKK